MLIGGTALLSLVAAVALCFWVDAFGSLAWLWVLPAGFAGAFAMLALLIFLSIWAACALVRLDKPQQKDSPFFRWIIGLVAEAAIPILRMRMHTQGLEKIPKDGRFLLVCNHLNDLDPVVLIHYFRKSQIAFISKRENSSMFLVGKLMHKIMCQLINRENDREALKTILRCVQLLQEDQVSIAVFPEGYTSVDGLLHPFRSGVFKIAQKAQVPIVVCSLQNTQKVFHNVLRLKATDVHLHLLDVIPPEQIRGITAVQVGARVHKLIADDLGPEKVLQSHPEDAQNT